MRKLGHLLFREAQVATLKSVKEGLSKKEEREDLKIRCSSSALINARKFQSPASYFVPKYNGMI